MDCAIFDIMLYYFVDVIPGDPSQGNASLDWGDGMPRNFLGALDTHQSATILPAILGNGYLGQIRQG